MYFDYFTAAALTDEFNETLAGGRVQDVVEIDDLSVGFEIFQQGRHYLYITADPETARIHLTDARLRRGMTKPSPIGLLLKRHIDGGRLMAVRQPAWERILLLDFMTPDGEFTLIFEPIERRTNLVLVENGTIRECIRRVGIDENRVRQLLPGYEYHLPPPQHKIEPGHVQIENIKRLLDANPGDKAHQALTRGIHGMSPLIGREITFRATGNANIAAGDTSARDLYESFKTVVKPLLDHQWQPGTTTENGQITAYAAYQITHRPGWQSTETISAALEAFYGEVSGDAAYEAGKQPIRAQIQDAKKRLSSKLFSLKKQKRDEAEIERLKQSGELILAYQYQIKRGDTLLEAQYDPEGEPLKIKLEPLLSPVDNAQKYFEKYDKAKRSRAALPDLIERTEQELDYLEQLGADLDIATNWTEIGEVQEALQEAGYWKGQKTRLSTGKSGPLKVVAVDGTPIWIGRNSRQNEQVTFEKGTPEDLWLHVHGVPGSHVIIKTTGRPVPKEIIRQAASLAAYFSKARKQGKVDVIVTERKHVRKIKGGKPGMVRVFQQSYPTMTVEPRAPEIEA